jgi:NADP-dependent alcohol dehydrogenase
MLNFDFKNPVKLYFGRGQVVQLANEIPKDQNILILSGCGSAKKNGAITAVKKALKDYSFFEFSGIEANPQYETLMKALPLIKKYNIGFLLAVGGGSVIDGTKFISAASCFEGSDTPWNIVAKQLPVEKALPFATVLTMPAAGSEMNCYAVISNRKTKEKISFSSSILFPQCSILDPTYSYTLPQQQTSNGIIDTFAHVMEQYLTYPVDSPLQDRFAESILVTLIEEAPRVLRSPDNYEVRANLMLCSTLALNDLISVGVPTDWTAHEIGHFLTAHFGIDHACTLAVLLPTVMQVKRDKKESKLLQYATRIWDIDENNKTIKIDKAIEHTRNFFRYLGAKTRLKDYGLNEKDIATVAGKIEEKGITPLGEHGDIDMVTVRQILMQSI